MINYLYIFGTVIFTVYGQIILKYRISKFGAFPDALRDKFFFLSKVFFDPMIISGFFAAFLAGVCWMAAMTKFEISFAYPFQSLSFVLVFLIGAIFLGESITWGKVIGLLLIILGIIVTIKIK